MAKTQFELTAENESHQNSLTLTIGGDLLQSTLSKDYFTSLAKGEQSRLRNARNISIDFSASKRIDTAGLAWLINFVGVLMQYQLDIKFVNTPEQLLNLAALSNAKDLLEEYV